MFDIVTWVKNGGWCLPRTLSQLEEVIPPNVIHRKIAIDDASTDDSVKILKRFGWEVHQNPGAGISAGANYALKLVDCQYFMSFEQDLFLSPDWFDKVTPLVTGKVAAASGIRFSDKPKSIGDIEKYVHKKYLMESLASYLKARKESAFTLGKTLDNTFYNTDVIMSVGGFPVMPSSSGVDTILAYKLNEAGFKWVVNADVQSVHFRKDLTQCLKHQYWYAVALNEVKRQLPSYPVSVKQDIQRLAISPLTALFMSIKMKNPKIFLFHPLLRYYRLMGLLSG